VWTSRTCPAGRHGDAGWSGRACAKGSVRLVWLPRLGYAGRQSSSACRLESIDPVTFLDRGGRACHSKSSRDARTFVRLSSEPPAKGEPGSRTWQPAYIAGCLGDNTRQTQTVISPCWPRPRLRVNSRLLPCLRCPFRIRTRSARVGHHCSDQQGGGALPRPRCWRPARRTQPQRGHLCGWPEHNYWTYDTSQ